LRVILCGSRGWVDLRAIRARVGALPANAYVIVGRARGADRMAEGVALGLGLQVDPHPANWKRHGRRAGMIRNREMLDTLRSGEQSERRLVIAFWDGDSPGTAGMIRMAQAAGVEVEIHTAEMPP
jgi:SLOG family YspA-like protein